MSRGTGPLLTVLLTIGLVWSVAYAADDFAAAFDADHNGRLDETELQALFEAHDPAIKTLRDAGRNQEADRLRQNRAIDVLTAKGPLQPSVLIRDAAQLYSDIVVPPSKGRHIGWQGLGFARLVVDAADPRGSKLPVPAVLAYTYDDTATDKNQLTALGGVTFYQWYPGETGNWTITPAMELDSTGTKPYTESSIKVGLPVARLWFWEEAAVESLTLTVSPKYGTDRRLDRDLWELSATLDLASPRGPRPGFWTFFGMKEAGSKPSVRLQWAPRLLVEFGEVNDSGGNAKLAAIADLGLYSRVGAQVAFTVRPRVLSEKLAFDLDYSYRYDFDAHHSYRYGELRCRYDVLTGDAKKSEATVQLTLTYRRGHKPPDFGKVDALLFGIGISQ